MNNLDYKIKHLEMIELVIERMARNCFQLKSWAITLVTIIGALGANDADKRFIFIALLPIIGFWFLDAFYLQQERKFKALYRSVCEKTDDSIDFNLNTRKVLFTNDESKRICFLNCLMSISVSLFYLVLIISVALIYAIVKGCFL